MRWIELTSYLVDRKVQEDRHPPLAQWLWMLLAVSACLQSFLPCRSSRRSSFPSWLLVGDSRATLHLQSTTVKPGIVDYVVWQIHLLHDLVNIRGKRLADELQHFTIQHLKYRVVFEASMDERVLIAFR